MDIFTRLQIYDDIGATWVTMFSTGTSRVYESFLSYVAKVRVHNYDTITRIIIFTVVRMNVSHRQVSVPYGQQYTLPDSGLVTVGRVYSGGIEIFDGSEWFSLGYYLALVFSTGENIRLRGDSSTPRYVILTGTL